MDRKEFERAAREQNQRALALVAEARRKHLPCDPITMLALGGETYCRSHRVMGPCPYGPAPTAPATAREVMEGMEDAIRAACNAGGLIHQDDETAIRREYHQRARRLPIAEAKLFAWACQCQSCRAWERRQDRREVAERKAGER